MSYLASWMMAPSTSADIFPSKSCDIVLNLDAYISFSFYMCRFYLLYTCSVVLTHFEVVNTTHYSAG